jgi:hypothetical protein
MRHRKLRSCHLNSCNLFARYTFYFVYSSFILRCSKKRLKSGITAEQQVTALTFAADINMLSRRAIWGKSRKNPVKVIDFLAARTRNTIIDWDAVLGRILISSLQFVQLVILQLFQQIEAESLASVQNTQGWVCNRIVRVTRTTTYK